PNQKIRHRGQRGSRLAQPGCHGFSWRQPLAQRGDIDMTDSNNTRGSGPKLDRRGFLRAGAAVAAGTAATMALPGRVLAAPTKPDELVVRAWGGAWQDALANGVAKPFTEKT